MPCRGGAGWRKRSERRVEARNRRIAEENRKPGPVVVRTVRDLTDIHGRPVVPDPTIVPPWEGPSCF